MKKKSTLSRKRLGMQVKKLGNNLGISQEELAFRSGMDRTYISGIERGIRNPSFDNIERLAKALRVSVSELFSF